MSSNVTSIHRASQSEGAAQSPVAGWSSLLTPIKFDDQLAMVSAVSKANRLADLRGIWIAYPNLKEATERLLELISTVWPGKGGNVSALSEAVLRSIERVQRGMERGETTRDFVVANYLAGLGSIAEDVVALNAWGYVRDTPQEQWRLELSSFSRWANGTGFSEIRFLKRTHANPSEVEGTRLKILCSIASAKDVGIVSRYHLVTP